MRIAIYPGTFDPCTYGHLDIIKRASSLYDKVYVAVMHNENKNALFTTEERVEMLKEETEDIENVEIVCDEGLTVDLAHKLKAQVIIRGIRATMDFEYELTQSTINMTLSPDLETVFLVARPDLSFLSSSSAKSVATFHGNLERFVTKNVQKKLQEKFK